LLAAIRARLRLLVMLRVAGGWPVAGIGVVGLLTSLIPAASAVTLAVLVGRLEAAIGGGDGVLGALALPLAGLAGVMLVGHLLDSVREPLHFLVRSRVDGQHRAAVSRLAASSDTIGALERPDVQRLVHLARADPMNWSERTPGDGAIALVALVGRGVTLLSTSAVLAAFAWWLIPLYVIPAVIYERLNRSEGQKWWRIWRDSYGGLQRAKVWRDAHTDPGPAKDLAIFGLGEYSVGRVIGHLDTMFVPVWNQVRGLLRRYWRQVILILIPLTVGFVAVAYQAATGQASIAVATAALSAGAAVFRIFTGDPNDVLGATYTLEAYDKLRAELQPARNSGGRPADRQRAAAPAPRSPHGVNEVIRFEGVGFHYPGTSRAVLDNLDLEIRPRELLAIVGLNGAGKSTLIKLLAGLYEPASGRITVGGQDIAAIGVGEWRRRLSVVFQDFVRYHLSAADNVALGNGAVPADLAVVKAAAQDAGLDVVLDRLPSGLATPLARTRTDGVDLSGGQWQQVVLARALYAVRTGADVLVLDEPTAHLDVATEFEVFERLAAHKGNASVVLISHRLSTVRKADRIVLLDGGRITEAGTHDELMARAGRYAELFTIQAERFQRGFDDRIEEGELR
jgi:ATP-binding cassette subfamily B protein